MIWTPQTLSFDDADTPLTNFNVSLHLASDNTQIGDLGGTIDQFTKSGNTYSRAVAPVNPANNPNAPANTDVYFAIQAQNGGQVSTIALSSVFQFSSQLSPVTNIVLS